MTVQNYNIWQHNHWANVANDWEKWSDVLAACAELYNQPLIQSAMLSEGCKVLDIACGTGEPAISVADIVKPKGQVVAVDYEPKMVDAAKKRAAARQTSNIYFRDADMHALPFEDAEFDRVISRFGIMYAEQPAQAATEIMRVLRPGGHIALMVWGPRQNNTVLNVAIDAANSVLEKMSAEALERPAIYAAPGKLSEIIQTIGFTEVRELDFDTQQYIPADPPFWHSIIEMTFGSDLSELQKRRVDETIALAYSPYLCDGVYQLRSHVRVLVAQKSKEL